MENIFESAVSHELILRINKLSPDSKPLWGKMSVDQMLAHVNVSYELVFEPEKHPSPNAFMRFILKLMVKKSVVNEIPYKKNMNTAPFFIIKDHKIFENEKTRLIGFIEKTLDLGESHFDGKMSHSFGKLTKKEWSNMFYKHLDHHLSQFAV